MASRRAGRLYRYFLRNILLPHIVRIDAVLVKRMTKGGRFNLGAFFFFGGVNLTFRAYTASKTCYVVFFATSNVDEIDRLA